MLTYSFKSQIIFNKLMHLIRVEPPYNMLSDLSSGFLSKQDGVQDTIDELNKLVNDEIEVYSFGGSDYCILECHKDMTNIYYDFGDNEATIKTQDIISLLKDWLIYLEKNNNIE